MTCKCGTDHEGRAPDLRSGEDRAGAQLRGRAYTTRTGRVVWLYPNGRVPDGLRAARGGACVCGSHGEGAECSCVPYRLHGEYGVTVRGWLPPWQPLCELPR